MNDPHVVALIYCVSHSEDANFDEAELLEFETSQFNVRVDNGSARFALKAHYSNVTEARAAIEPFIHMWEVWDALNPDLSGFGLEYSASEVVDRNPPPGNYGHSVLPGLRMSAHGVKNIGRRYYPEAPTEQAVMNADVEVMAYRHWLYRKDRDTLAAMAYFCLTVLENSTGRLKSKRKHAALQYNVDPKVLKKLGDLTDSKGGRNARKGHGVERDFTPSEQMWIELIIKLLIRRVADFAHDPNRKLPTIRMTNLPSLQMN
jgi:hypothetical protein